MSKVFTKTARERGLETLRGRCSRNSGVTMIEASVYIAVLVIFAGLMSSVVRVAARSASESDTQNRVAERNRVALFRLASDLRSSVASTVSVPTGGQSLTFSPPADFDGTTVIPGAAINVTLGLATGEQLNDQDDNGNGLIDEGQLVRQDTATGETLIICQDLDLNNCSFVQNGNAIVVTITNVGYLRHGDETYGTPQSLTITPRN